MAGQCGALEARGRAGAREREGGREGGGRIQQGYKLLSMPSISGLGGSGPTKTPTANQNADSDPQRNIVSFSNAYQCRNKRVATGNLYITLMLLTNTK